MSDSTPDTSIQRNPEACSATYSSSAVLPTPASPRSTSTWQLPARTVDIRPRSVSHSLSRPRRLIPRPWLDIGSTASFCTDHTGLPWWKPTSRRGSILGYAFAAASDAQSEKRMSKSVAPSPGTSVVSSIWTPQ